METLDCLSLPANIKSLIFHCILSVNMSVNWNGSMTNYFQTSKGLRQGDSISPYLFVLCLERLGHMIHDVC